jgi:hypothetical protein
MSECQFDKYYIFIKNSVYLKSVLRLFQTKSYEQRGINMSNNWMTMAEAVTVISKNSHHQVSPHHVQTLVNRRKIGARSFHGETTFLKCSDVKSTRVAINTGSSHRRDEAAL